MTDRNRAAIEMIGRCRSQTAAAVIYCLLIREMYRTGDADVAEVNAAIKERWSFAGLKRVKDLAWKMHEQNPVEKKSPA